MTAATTEIAGCPSGRSANLGSVLRERFDADVELLFGSPWRNEKGTLVEDVARLDEA